MFKEGLSPTTGFVASALPCEVNGFVAGEWIALLCFNCETCSSSCAIRDLIDPTSKLSGWLDGVDDVVVE
jgi:hypothetical protein